MATPFWGAARAHCRFKRESEPRVAQASVIAQFFSRMKRALIITWMLGMGLVAHAADKPVLKVYIAAKDAGKGLHQADFPRLPKVGYIGEKPDLTISQLEGVEYGLGPRYPNPDGGYFPPQDDKRSLRLRLTTKDAEALQKLTSAHIGSRLLLMLNDQPLVAPEIQTPLTEQSMYINSMPKGFNVDELKAKLEALVDKSKEPRPTVTPAPKV
jgi:hypothetical protein